MTSRVDKAREIVGHPLDFEEDFVQSPMDGMPSKRGC
jgi:hypothetical protein